jgi:hypothetical protein
MSKLIRVTATGEQHGLINTLTNSVNFDDFKHMDGKTKEICKKEKKEDERLVKVRYMNRRGRHERLTKHYCRWAGDPIQQWHLIPGQEYELPMGFVKEVNGIKYTRRAGLLSQDGVAVTKDESPLEQDQDDERLHELVPAAYF